MFFFFLILFAVGLVVDSIRALKLVDDASSLEADEDADADTEADSRILGSMLLGDNSSPEDGAEVFSAFITTGDLSFFKSPLSFLKSPPSDSLLFPRSSLSLSLSL